MLFSQGAIKKVDHGAAYEADMMRNQHAGHEVDETGFLYASLAPRAPRALLTDIPRKVTQVLHLLLA